SSRRRHTRSKRDWSSDVCSSDLPCVHARTIATSTDTGSGSSVLRRIEDAGGLLAPQFFDVDVASRHHADGGDESCGPEHVPHPRIRQLDRDPSTFEPLKIHLVGEVEASLGLDHIREHREYVSILPVELEFALLLEPLD